MDTLKQLDMVVVVFATDHLDVETTYVYGQFRTDAEVLECATDSLKQQYGFMKLEGLEFLSIVR